LSVGQWEIRRKPTFHDLANRRTASTIRKGVICAGDELDNNSRLATR
jgi:hypothetical protein